MKWLNTALRRTFLHFINVIFVYIGHFQELGDQLNKVKAEKEKALKSLKALKVNHDVSVSVLMAPKTVNVQLKDIQWYFFVLI